MFRVSSITSDDNEEKEDIKIICEALGCTNKSNEKLMVKVGTLGFIELALCKKCKAFFDNLNKNFESIDKISEKAPNQPISIVKELGNR